LVLANAFRNYLQFADGKTKTHWKDLIRSQLRQLVTVPESRAQRIARKQQIALEIAAIPNQSSAEKMRLYEELTGEDGRGYYRSLKRARR
jgi:hypothetical protein